MGMLIDGHWRPDTDRYMKDCTFMREASGMANPTLDRLFAHLVEHADCVIVGSKSCPWSHRVALVRAVKGLDHVRLLSAGEPRTEGYAAPKDLPGAVGPHVHQHYSATDATFTGRATVPLVWDPHTQRVIANDSSLIARALDRLETQTPWTLRPRHLAEQIDALNARLYGGLANAVYQAGFATTQAAYGAAVHNVFDTLAWLDTHLHSRRFLCDQTLTEADIFLFPTLARFDAIYAPLFRCTRRRLVDHPAVWSYARDVHSLSGVAETVDADADRAGYFLNDTDNNPHGIIPEAPQIDWSAPHDRARLGEARVWTGSKAIPFSHVERA